MKKFLALILAALMLCGAAFAEEAPSADYEAVIAEKDAEIAELRRQLQQLMEDYEELNNAHQNLLAQTAYSLLTVGSKGEEVTKLQDRLSALGYLEGDSDGKYGNGTKAAVESFQKLAGLEVTGNADGKTQFALYDSNAPKATAVSTSSSFSESEYEDYSYETHRDMADAYNGRKVTFIGTILQALDHDGTAIFRIATSGEKDNVVYATYRFTADEGLLYKGDNVTVYAVTAGTFTYKTVTGNEKTLPSVEIKAIEKRS